jgi:hypothetical protein
MTFKPLDLVRRANGKAPMVVARSPPGAKRVSAVYVPGRPYQGYMAYLSEIDAAHVDATHVDAENLVRLPIDEVDGSYRYRVTLAHLKACFGPDVGREIYNHNQPKETTMSKLYQTKEETPRFGTKLAVNSAGKTVLEMKGTGEVLAFDKHEIEIVHPYTVDVLFPGTSTHYSYLSRKGEVEVGDLLLIDDERVAKVVRVDTKSPRATKPLKGRKVLSTAIGEGLTAEAEDMLDD